MSTLSLFIDGNPTLPELRSLLVLGKYHPSAPLELCLSRLKHDDTSTALLFTSSKRKFKERLHDFDNGWTLDESGKSSNALALSRIQIFYPPSAAHLAVALSEIHVVDDRIEQPPAHPSTALSSCPSLIVINELSSYLTEDASENHDTHPWTVPAFLNLIVQTIVLQSRLSKGRRPNQPELDPVFALFDSQLDSLKLPIIKNPSRPAEVRPGDAENSKKLEHVSHFVMKYFEWVAMFELVKESEMDEVPSSQDEENIDMNVENEKRKERVCLRLFRGPYWKERRDECEWILEGRFPDGGAPDEEAMLVDEI